MNNKVLYAIIVALVVIIVAGGAYFLGSRGAQKERSVNSPASSQPSATETKSTLSEQPDKAKYGEYLSDIYLGKMAVGKKIGADGFPTRTNVFTSGTDQFCTMMTLKKSIVAGTAATAVYDIAAGQDNSPKTIFPMGLKAGGSGGCGSLTQPPGKYEYKLYVDNVLVAVLPFEVK